MPVLPAPSEAFSFCPSGQRAAQHPHPARRNRESQVCPSSAGRLLLQLYSLPRVVHFLSTILRLSRGDHTHSELKKHKAEEWGFEPQVPLRVQWFSRPPPSTARPFLRRGQLNTSSLWPEDPCALRVSTAWGHLRRDEEHRCLRWEPSPSSWRLASSPMALVTRPYRFPPRAARPFSACWHQYGQRRRCPASRSSRWSGNTVTEGIHPRGSRARTWSRKP